jgi:hypothetical protein
LDVIIHVDDITGELGNAVHYELFGDGNNPEGIVEIRAGSRVSDPDNKIELHADGEVQFAVRWVDNPSPKHQISEK